MIRLSSIIKRFKTGFLTNYRGRLLPSHRNALGAMENCRSKQSPKMLVGCTQCDEQHYVPHSCGHRKVFRAKMLEAIGKEGLAFPAKHPEK